MLSRVGISLENDLLDRFDELIGEKGYTNRSEAIRDLIRDELVKREWESSESEADKVAVVVLVFDHSERELGRKLTQAQHEHHHEVVSTMHIHMDDRHCLEMLVLRGRASKVIATGNRLVSTSGVKLGRLILASTGEGL